MGRLSKVAKDFEHPDHIPVEFAMSVYRVMHNQASYNDWELFDFYIARNEDVLSWVMDVLKANKVRNIKDERKWWAKELGLKHTTGGNTMRTKGNFRTKGGIRTKAEGKQDLSPTQKAYREFFKGVMQKWGISSPAELDEADKKKFFTEVEEGWNERKGKRTKDTRAMVSVDSVVDALVALGEVEIAEALEEELSGNKRWAK